MSFDEFTQQQLGLGIFSSNTNLPAPPQLAVGQLPLASPPPRQMERMESSCMTPVNNQVCNSCAAQVRTCGDNLAIYVKNLIPVNCGHCGVVSL